MSDVDLGKMLPLFGNWQNSTNMIARFSSDESPDSSHGLALLSTPLDDGVLDCDIQLPSALAASGAFIIFRANGQTSYHAAGLGGWEGAYTLAEGRNLTMTRIVSAGNISKP